MTVRDSFASHIRSEIDGLQPNSDHLKNNQTGKTTRAFFIQSAAGSTPTRLVFAMGVTLGLGVATFFRPEPEPLTPAALPAPAPVANLETQIATKTIVDTSLTFEVPRIESSFEGNQTWDTNCIPDRDPDLTQSLSAQGCVVRRTSKNYYHTLTNSEIYKVTVTDVYSDGMYTATNWTYTLVNGDETVFVASTGYTPEGDATAVPNIVLAFEAQHTPHDLKDFFPSGL